MWQASKPVKPPLYLKSSMFDLTREVDCVLRKNVKAWSFYFKRSGTVVSILIWLPRMTGGECLDDEAADEKLSSSLKDVLPPTPPPPTTFDTTAMLSTEESFSSSEQTTLSLPPEGSRRCSSWFSIVTWNTFEIKQVALKQAIKVAFTLLRITWHKMAVYILKKYF